MASEALERDSLATTLLEAIRNSHFVDHEPVMDDMFRVSFERIKAEYPLIDGDILEFGVFDGKSINRMADLWPDRALYGFDSFEGLPEDWDLGSKIYRKQTKWAMKTLPPVRENVSLIKGFFDQTLPQWWEQNRCDIALLHVDCDLYSSTKTVLDTVNDGIRPGTIIRLDDLIDFREFENYEGKGSEISQYTTWRQHEWKAFVEWLETYDRVVQPLFRGWFQWVVVKVIV